MTASVFFRAIAALCLGLAGSVSVQAQQAPEQVRVALSWLRNGQYAALMVADAKGYFAQEGLKLALIDGGPAKNPVPAVGAGQAQFGIANSSAILSARLAPSPVDVVAVGALLQEFPYAYLTLRKPGDPEPTPKDFEGRRVGIQAPDEIYLKALAKRSGIDLSKVKVDLVLATPEPLLVGKVDFFGALLPNQTYQIEAETSRPDGFPAARGKVWKAVRFSEFGVRHFGDVLFTSGALVRERPELVRKVMRAVARGLQFTIEHPQETVRLVDAYPQQIERADKLAWRLKIQTPLSQSAETRAHGLLWMDARPWEDLMSFYLEQGQIPRTVPVSDMATNAFNPGIKPR